MSTAKCIFRYPFFTFQTCLIQPPPLWTLTPEESTAMLTGSFDLMSDSSRSIWSLFVDPPVDCGVVWGLQSLHFTNLERKCTKPSVCL